MSTENRNLLNRAKISFLIFVSLFTISFSVIGGNDVLPDTIRSCRVDSLIIDAGLGFDKYLWSTGDTLSYIWVANSGLYTAYFSIDDTTEYYDTTYVNIFNVGIIQSDTSILCGDTITLNVDSIQYNYLWEPGLEEIDSIVVYPRDTSTFLVTIVDPESNLNYCTDSVKVIVEPIIFTDTLVQTEIGCPDEEAAKVNIVVSGGYPPYIYEWSQGFPLSTDPSSAYGLSDGDRWVRVTDTIGCLLKHDFVVKAHSLPEGIIHFDPDSIVYIQKPIVSFEYENVSFDSLGTDTFQINTWTWDFGDEIITNEIAPTHIYSSEGDFTVSYNYITKFGCPGTDSIIIKVLPVDLKIPTVITPNGDEFNNKFVIWYADGSDSNGDLKYSNAYDEDEEEYDPLNTYYLTTELIIFNRWGEKIYEDKDYHNDWGAEGLVDGTYFYVIVCKGQWADYTYKGSFLVLASPF